jgi:hypothetical protein
MVAGVVFGAIHCIAWSFDFRFHTELFLWRLSSMIITSVPAFLLLSLGAVSLLPDEGLLIKLFVPIVVIVGILMPLFGLIYILARLTTIVLAFINLSSLPPGAFQAVHWTTLVPHL